MALGWERLALLQKPLQHSLKLEQDSDHSLEAAAHSALVLQLQSPTAGCRQPVLLPG